MKKLGKVPLIILAVVVALALLAFGYVFFVINRHFLIDLRSIADAPSKYSVTVTETDREYKAAVRGGNPHRYVVYDADRKVIRAVGVTPIDFDRRNFWGLWTYEDFLAEYGEPHDVIPSSDIYWPVWFTDDGYIITLWCAGEDWMNLFITIGNYGEVGFYDLLATPE